MPPSTPTTPKSQFDFIMQNGQPAKKAGRLPLPNLPKPVLIIAGLVVLFILYSTISSAISKDDKPNYGTFIGALARGQEIARVSVEVEHITQASSATQNIASTANNIMTSQQITIAAYLATLGVSAGTSINNDLSKTTDTAMATAATNNNLDSTYVSYLKTELATYDNDLRMASAVAGPHGKALIAQDIANIQIILNSSQVAAANSQ